MNVSISFYLHMIGFGLLCTSLFGGWILERRIRAEEDMNQKRLIAAICRRFGLLSSFTSVLLLLTGVVNIINVFGDHAGLWHTEGWLIAKIILFAFMLVNGAVFGPVLIRRRTKLLQTLSEQNAPEDSATHLVTIQKSISTFYLVQFLLLLIILYLSTAGSGKHPGIF